jgi:cephalosporin hydroxylase
MADRLDQGSSLPRRVAEGIQNGTLRYAYKGVPMLKDPFDLALYQMLFWRLKPRCLIEIGSKAGGSAFWFADVLAALGVAAQVHSVDLEPPNLEIPGVVFHCGDARRLGDTFPDAVMRDLPRPLLVVEDADHHAETTLCVLEFFDAWLAPGEYIVVEDGIVDDLYEGERLAQFAGGPRQAVRTFLAARGFDYELDAELCDFYGGNVTWNVNGYLRRVR